MYVHSVSHNVIPVVVTNIPVLLVPDISYQYPLIPAQLLFVHVSVAAVRLNGTVPVFVYVPVNGVIAVTCEGLSLSMFVIVTVVVVTFNALSVATKSNDPFPVNVCHVTLSVPSSVLANTSISSFVRHVIYGSIVISGAVIS
jgi:hypothetical protein